jgi:hypothetical protein
MVPRDDRKEEEILILSNIVRRVDSNESVAEAPECVQLKFGLDAQYEEILI